MLNLWNTTLILSNLYSSHHHSHEDLRARTSLMFMSIMVETDLQNVGMWFVSVIDPLIAMLCSHVINTDQTGKTFR